MSSIFLVAMCASVLRTLEQHTAIGFLQVSPNQFSSIALRFCSFPLSFEYKRTISLRSIVIFSIGSPPINVPLLNPAYDLVSDRG